MIDNQFIVFGKPYIKFGAIAMDRIGFLKCCGLQLLSGGLMLGAVFMATDYVTSPMSKKGMLIYGVCIGLLTVVIRLFGAYPEGMSFAILIMNAFTPLINTYCKPKRFGEVAKKK